MKYLIIFLLFSAPLLAIEGKGGGLGGPEESSEIETPWLTGTLLTPSATVIPKGHYSIESYIFGTNNFGIYNGHWRPQKEHSLVMVDFLLSLEYGLAERIDVKAFPQFFVDFSRGQKSCNIGDLPVGIDFQLLSQKPGEWHPDIKISFTETFPTGKYDHLNPDKFGTDATGLGSYISVIGLYFGKLFHFSCDHYLSARFGASYAYLAPVHVKGFNSYGGTFDTKGKVYPGNSFLQGIGLEYTLTKHWALALDIVNIYNKKARFSGHNGALSPLTRSSNQVSLAPAIEYNWSQNWGIIGGVWFTVAGRNAFQFYSGVLALSYYK